MTESTGRLWLRTLEGFVDTEHIIGVLPDDTSVLVQTPAQQGASFTLTECDSPETAVEIAEDLIHALSTQAGQSGVIQLDEDGEFALATFS